MSILRVFQRAFTTSKNHLTINMSLFVFSLGVWLRCYALSSNSPTYEELRFLEYFNANKSFFEVLRLSLNEVYSPVYNLLLWLTYKCTGNHVLSGRFLSSVLGSINLIVFYKFGNTLNVKHSALFVLFVATVFPLFIQLSREANEFALLLLFMTCAVYTIRKYFDKYSSKHLISSAVFMSLALHVNVLSLLLLPLFACLSLLESARPKVFISKNYFNWLMMVVAISPFAISNAFAVFVKFIRQNNYSIVSGVLGILDKCSKLLRSNFDSVVAIVSIFTFVLIFMLIKNKWFLKRWALALTAILFLTCTFHSAYKNKLRYPIYGKVDLIQALLFLEGINKKPAILCFSLFPSAYKFYSENLQLQALRKASKLSNDEKVYLIADHRSKSDISAIESFSQSSWVFASKSPRIYLLSKESLLKLPDNILKKIVFNCGVL